MYYVEGFSQQEIAAISNVHCDTIQKLFWEQRWILRDKQKPKTIGDIDLERSEYQRKRRQTLKDARARIFGTKCYACHSEKNPIEKSLHLHLKDGTEHDRNLFRSLKRLESLYPDDWVPLCDRCHLGIHMLMKAFGVDWARIEIFLEGRKKTSNIPKETLDLPIVDTPTSKDFKKLGQDFEVTIDNCTGIDENDHGFFRVFPNPASNYLNIDFDAAQAGKCRLSILNILGHIMYTDHNISIQSDHSLRINLEDYPEGIYIIRILTDQNVICQKKIIKVN